MKSMAVLLLVFAQSAFSQETSEARELIGQLGGRNALLNLYTTTRADGSARITGDYLVLQTMQQRFLEGERSKQLGVTFLREGISPILYGRPETATLQVSWQCGVFQGAGFSAGGRLRGGE